MATASKPTARSLLHAISQQLQDEAVTTEEQRAIMKQSVERGQAMYEALAGTHSYLTNEQRAANEGRQTTQQQLNNAVLKRQIRERAAKQQQSLKPSAETGD